MKHLAPLLLLCCVGCLDHQPGKVGDPASTAAGAVTVRELGEALAVLVDHCEDTDEFWRKAKRTCDWLELPATNLDQLGTVEANKAFDEGMRQDFKQRCKGMR